MDIVYIFIKTKRTFSLRCFQMTVKNAQEKDSILNLPYFTQPNTNKQVHITYSVGFPEGTNLNRSYGNPEKNKIIEIECTVDNEANAAQIITALKAQFPQIQVADAFPRCGTLSFNQCSTTPAIKLVPDSSLSMLFELENIRFERVYGHSNSLFPNYRLTSDQIKQTALGECAFAAMITGFCADRPHTIYNCMRDNLDGSILVRLYSYEPSTTLPNTSVSIPRFYLIEKSKMVDGTTQGALSEHFLWANILLKAYAIHRLHLRQEEIASAPSPSPSTLSTSPEPPAKLNLRAFFNGIEYIDLAHALTGNQKVDFFAQPYREDKNLVTRANAHTGNPSNPPQSCMTLLADLKKLCCPVYLCTSQEHFVNVPTRVIAGNTLYSKHAYCVLKVRTDCVTLLNPWQHTIKGQDAHTSHLRYSMHPGAITPSSSSPAALSSDFAAMMQQSDELDLDHTLYDADAENYGGAIKIPTSDLLLGFDTIHAWRPETLWNQIKNEIIKILQAYIQFAGYHAGLAAILQRIFLNYLSDDMPLIHLAQIVEELYAVDQSLDTYHLPNTPIQILARELNSFLPTDKRVVPVMAASAHPKNFSLYYAGELSVVHTQMNALYKPYRKLFQILHSESLKAYTLREEYALSCSRLESALALVQNIDIQMYGETLLTYAITMACSYKSFLIVNFFDILLSKHPSLVQPNKAGKSPLRVAFEKASRFTGSASGIQCVILLMLAKKIIFRLRSQQNPENIYELQQIQAYIQSLSSVQLNDLKRVYSNEASAEEQQTLWGDFLWDREDLKTEESAEFQMLRCLKAESDTRTQLLCSEAAQRARLLHSEAAHKADLLLRSEFATRTHLLHSEAAARALLRLPAQWKCRQCNSIYPSHVLQCIRCRPQTCPHCGQNALIHLCCRACGYSDPSIKFQECRDYNSDDDK